MPVVLLGVVAAVFLVVSMPRITATFGDSDEGINGAVWASNSRALREDGPIESRLGGRRLDGTEYATHPPYIVLSTAVSEIVAGEREWASRAPAWIASLASVALLYVFVRRVGVDPVPAAAATAATALTPMVFTYGFMLDTPVVSLPFGIAVLIAWLASWRAGPGERGWHPAATAGLCAIAVLTGWQAAVLTALAGITLLVRAGRNRHHELTASLPFLLGGVIGVALSLSWTWWVYGDFSTLSDKFFRRSGESNSVGLGDMVSFQLPWLVQLLGIGLVGLGASVAALWDRRVRAAAAMSLAIVVVYALAFRQAAAGHQYWNYWALIPTAVGFAWMFDKVARDITARARLPVLVGACAVIAVVNLVVLDDEARRYIDEGHEVADLVAAADYPADQTVAPYIGPPYRPDAWLGYYTRRPPTQFTSNEQVRQFMDGVPGGVAVVLGWCDRQDPAHQFCRDRLDPRAGTAPDGEFAPVPRVGSPAQIFIATDG